MDVANRRKFLKGFGLLGAVVAGASAPVIIEKTREVQVPLPFPKSDPKVVAQIVEQTPATITLLSKYGEIAPPPPSVAFTNNCLLYTSPSPRDRQKSRMPSSA